MARPGLRWPGQVLEVERRMVFLGARPVAQSGCSDPNARTCAGERARDVVEAATRDGAAGSSAGRGKSWKSNGEWCFWAPARSLSRVVRTRTPGASTGGRSLRGRASSRLTSTAARCRSARPVHRRATIPRSRLHEPPCRPVPVPLTRLTQRRVRFRLAEAPSTLRAHAGTDGGSAACHGIVAPRCPGRADLHLAAVDVGRDDPLPRRLRPPVDAPGVRVRTTRLSYRASAQ